MKSLEQLDLKHLWHPFTQQAEWKRDIRSCPMVIARGKGNYLYDSKGKKYLDAVSSLWANIHGHQNRQIDSAIRRQLKKVAHSTFLGLTHEPGIRLAEELIRIAPKNLNRVFYSDNGSTAVEVALKMAFQYHRQKKISASGKTEFLALKNSYHGDTVGAVSVGGIELFHEKFRALLFKTHFAISPNCPACPYNGAGRGKHEVRKYQYKGEKPKPGNFRKETECRWECLRNVERILRKNSQRIAAAIIEPVVQAAGGIIVMPPGYLWGFSRLCKNYGVPLIADEVAVGFGRTGKMFACEHEGVHPDFLCLSKGITGGYLPLGATLTTENVYRAFLGSYNEYKTFFHGHTYTANPLACQASRANLEIFKKENSVRKVKKMEQLLTDLLGDLFSIPVVRRIRQAGLIAGIEIAAGFKGNKLSSFPPSMRIGKNICMEARKYGILLRPLGDVIVLMPPLSIKEKELRFLMSNLKEAIIAVDGRRLKK